VTTTGNEWGTDDLDPDWGRILLSDAELEVLDHLTQAAKSFFGLPEHHPTECAEFASDMHHIQERIMARAAIRAYPSRFTPMVRH
jgi:hypothetical protein